MDLNLYQIILGPIISDKAYKLNKQLSKLVLKVHPKANKPLVAEALEKLFNVKVKKVSIVVVKGKNRQVRRLTVTGALTKKAIVTLAEGYSLDLLDQTGSQVTPDFSKQEHNENGN